jgi:hypothetical protein
MNQDLLGGLAVGLVACLVGVGGIVAAIRRYQRRAAIASTFGQTGGIAYTVAQAGCSGLLLIGGVALIVIALLIKR